MSAFLMPSLGADMEAGTLVEWFKRPGDPVAHGEVIAVVETQKGAIEIEIFESGVLERLLVKPGETVPVGTILAQVRSGGDATEAPPAPAGSPTKRVSTPAMEPARSPAPAAATAQPLREGRLRISPLARRRSAALGVDPADVRGTGEGGAVRVADVEAAAAPAPPRATRGRGFDPAAMRQAIAAAMARSKRDIPHYYIATAIDMAKAAAWLEETNARRPVAERLLLATLLLKAVAVALREVPDLNGFWLDGAFRPSERVHLGWAIAMRGGGLMAPAIHDADAKSLDELMAGLRDLVARVRGGGIRGSEMTDPTMTVTSLGERGVETVFGVIYPPQVAIVGFGKLVDAPRAVGRRVAVRPTIQASLAADHRASDGHRGGRFLAALDSLLQEPEKL